jgi:hypothetical protein
MNEIETEFVPYNVAVELKELGFDEPCFGYFDMEDENVLKCDVVYENENLSAPTYRQAFKFFRDKYKLSSWIYNSDLDKYFFTVLQNGRIIKANQSTDSYELAELACLNKLIKICKNEQ